MSAPCPLRFPARPSATDLMGPVPQEGSGTWPVRPGGHPPKPRFSPDRVRVSPCPSRGTLHLVTHPQGWAWRCFPPCFKVFPSVPHAIGDKGRCRRSTPQGWENFRACSTPGQCWWPELCAWRPFGQPMCQGFWSAGCLPMLSVAATPHLKKTQRPRKRGRTQGRTKD